MPEDMPANIEARLTKKLSPMETSTSPRITRDSFAGGTKMAMNMPYRPTDRALTTEAGKILPRITPRQVPAAQPGQARAMAP